MNRYDNYRDSRIDLLGPLPAHWGTYRIKDISRINDEALDEDTDPNYVLQYIDIGNVSSDGKIAQIQELQFKDAPSRARRKVKNGDTILSTVRTYLKAISHIQEAPDNLIASTGYAVFRPHSGIFPKFLYYLVNVEWFVDTVVARSTGVAYPAINPPQLAAISTWLPLPKEQEDISNYLDKETARIDQLIANKLQQIKKLDELRQIMISNAIIRGLDHTVRMKDSGIEWLGEIPAHWQVSRVKRYTISMEQGWSPQCESRVRHDGEWGVLKVGCVNGTTFNAEEHKALPSSLDPRPEYEIKKDDILISRANTRQLLGNACLVEKDYPQLMLCDKLYRLRLQQNRLTNEFLVYYLGTFAARYQIEREATGTSGSMQNIGQDTIKGLQVAVPPIEEQGYIVKFIQDEAKKFDSLASSTNKQIEKLEELRKITINDAVTGKVKVTD